MGSGSVRLPPAPIPPLFCPPLPPRLGSGFGCDGFDCDGFGSTLDSVGAGSLTSGSGVGCTGPVPPLPASPPIAGPLGPGTGTCGSGWLLLGAPGGAESVAAGGGILLLGVVAGAVELLAVLVLPVGEPDISVNKPLSLPVSVSLQAANRTSAGASRASADRTVCMFFTAKFLACFSAYFQASASETRPGVSSGSPKCSCSTPTALSSVVSIALVGASVSTKRPVCKNPPAVPLMIQGMFW